MVIDTASSLEESKAYRSLKNLAEAVLGFHELVNFVKLLLIQSQRRAYWVTIRVFWLVVFDVLMNLIL